MKRIILASNSPRRKELLKKSGIEFEVIPSLYEEELDVNGFSYDKIESLAHNKALDVAKRIEGDGIIIGADTVVVYEDEILTKPSDREHAIYYLQKLSDVEHKVVTSVCVINKYTNETKLQSVTTKVHFSKLTDEMITDYIDVKKPYDKAGSYGIQELPPSYIKYVDGSLENVIGLPTETVKEMLKD
jgi:septum formation protein